jgi:hypothetical protein
MRAWREKMDAKTEYIQAKTKAMLGKRTEANMNA